MRKEILPEKWVFVSFHGRDPDNLTPDYFGTLTPELVFQDWVIFGTLSDAKAKAQQVWEQLSAGHNWTLQDIQDIH
jgi:hypothetical protein